MSLYCRLARLRTYALVYVTEFPLLNHFSCLCLRLFVDELSVIQVWYAPICAYVWLHRAPLKCLMLLQMHLVTHHCVFRRSICQYG